MQKAVFFDRDGVIVKNVEGVAPKRPEDLELVPESVSVIKSLQAMGYKIFIVSNQPDIALGRINEKTRKALTQKFEDLLQRNHVSNIGIYYCFHHPQGINEKYTKDCDCRKPKPGMILRATREHRIDLTSSFTVGDRATDIKAGSLAGIRTILIDPENGEQVYLQEYQVKSDFTIKKIDEVVDIVKRNI